MRPTTIQEVIYDPAIEIISLSFTIGGLIAISMSILFSECLAPISVRMFIFIAGLTVTTFISGIILFLNALIEFKIKTGIGIAAIKISLIILGIASVSFGIKLLLKFTTTDISAISLIIAGIIMFIGGCIYRLGSDDTKGGLYDSNAKAQQIS